MKNSTVVSPDDGNMVARNM